MTPTIVLDGDQTITSNTGPLDLSLRPVWPDPPLRSSRVAIVGFATESRYEAPYDDPDCEIWGLNMAFGWIPRLDRLWELHTRTQIEKESAEENRARDALKWLRENTTVPVYMVEAQPDFPMSRRQPIELLKAYLGPLCDKIARTPYFTSTFAFMIATAVMGIVQRRRDPRVPDPGEQIIIAGVEMLNGEEYAYQRSCAEFWCGYVLGHGIQLDIPARSALLESDGLYGYAPPDNLELLQRQHAYYTDWKRQAILNREEAAKRRGQAQADWNSHDASIQTLDRILNHLTYLQRGGKV